ncbi:putative porin [Maribacter sp. 2307ULW6-5]|uniref:putative porin n=1 Tax=Maribacter sp. 2307ULW6-5 TaxID=3386275 RepID=UPI0039BC96D3
MKPLFALLFLLSCSCAMAQTPGEGETRQDSLSGPVVSPPDSVPGARPLPRRTPRPGPQNDSLTALSIEDYKIISHQRDTTFLDTTLTIDKEYRYNYLRKDLFELMPFANIGQTYNQLGRDFERHTLYPALGALAKHFNYWEVRDMKYYHVPTPMTDILFKTTLEEGQLLDAMLTFNTSKQLNFSIGYKGHRSLGKYQFAQIQSGNFTTTANYGSKDGRYLLRAHIAAQDIKSEENGGLVSKELQFESGDPDFINRPRVAVRFDDADNVVLGKRYYLDHRYKLLRSAQDSTGAERTSLTFGHTLNYETKYYQYIQSAADTIFGAALLPDINDRSALKALHNQASVTFYNRTLGRLTGSVDAYNYSYQLNARFIAPNGQVIQEGLNGTELALGGTYSKNIGGFDLHGSFKYNLAGNLTGNIFDATASYRFNDDHRVRFSVHSSSRMPNFNFLLYQSEYLNYNWQNNETFDKERVSSFKMHIDSKKWGTLTAKYSLLGNHTYFGTDPNATVAPGSDLANTRPLQADFGISHIKVKYAKEFKWRKFALNNTLMYQTVGQENPVLNVPQLVTRNSLYFSSEVFKKAMFLQTGITFKYFTAYHMDAYNPLLAEFQVQNTEKLGGFPLLDFFINARVQQTRIYLKAEHFNSSFTGYNFYTAPNYPYRDFVIRFGLVWNFFS